MDDTKPAGLPGLAGLPPVAAKLPAPASDPHSQLAADMFSARKEPENMAMRRARRLPTRSTRREEEKEPSADYVDRLRALGPREGESYLAFHKRISMVEGTRKLWADMWRKYGGNREDVARALGIPVSNLSFEQRLVGLSSRLLNDMLLGTVQL